MFYICMYVCMYVHKRACMNSLLINDFALDTIEFLFGSKFPPAAMLLACTRKVPGSKPVVRADIILPKDFRLSLILF